MPNPFHAAPLPNGKFKVLQLPDFIGANSCRVVCDLHNSDSEVVRTVPFKDLATTGIEFATLAAAVACADVYNGKAPQLLNRDTIVRLASQLANNGDAIESDACNATDHDDVSALLSHLDILDQVRRQLRDVLRATLEERAIS